MFLSLKSALDGVVGSLTDQSPKLVYELNAAEDAYSVSGTTSAIFGPLTIPSVHNGLPVDEIKGEAFKGETALTDVVIPNGVTLIGSAAFMECFALNDITIPNSVTSIGGSAFYECTSLTEITLPNNLTTIGGEAFIGCSSLTSVVIPNSVTTLSGGAFQACTSLTSATLQTI